METTNKESYIDFSIDFNGECEGIDDFYIGDDDLSGEVSDYDLNDFIQKLSEVDGFYVSEHRTQVRIDWNENGTMDIRYRYYNQPDWDDYEDHQLIGIPRIELEIK